MDLEAELVTLCALRKNKVLKLYTTKCLKHFVQDFK